MPNTRASWPSRPGRWSQRRARHAELARRRRRRRASGRVGCSSHRRDDSPRKRREHGTRGGGAHPRAGIRRRGPRVLRSCEPWVDGTAQPGPYRGSIRSWEHPPRDAGTVHALARASLIHSHVPRAPSPTARLRRAGSWRSPELSERRPLTRQDECAVARPLRGHPRGPPRLRPRGPASRPVLVARPGLRPALPPPRGLPRPALRRGSPVRRSLPRRVVRAVAPLHVPR
jgi:hypothetical protein